MSGVCWERMVRVVAGQWRGTGELGRSVSCYSLGIEAKSCQGFQCFKKHWIFRKCNVSGCVKHCASQLKHVCGPDGARRWSVCHPRYPLLAYFPEVNGCPG